MKPSSLGLFMLAALSAFGAAPAFAQQVQFVSVNRDVIVARLQQASTKNAQREAGLKRLFEEAGCRGERLTEQPVKGSRLPNLVCTLPGATDSVVIVGAHFDQAEVGRGIADNWSGAALLPSLFESLRAQPRRHTFVFVGFTDEEKGLVGSEFYAKQMTEEQKAKTRAMVNLDTLGLSSTKVWLSHADQNLAAALDRVAQAMGYPLMAVNVDQVGTADSESFAKRKMPSLTIHSVTQETFPILHSQRDSFEAIKLDDYYQTYRLLAAYLAYLDLLPDSPQPAGK